MSRATPLLGDLDAVLFDLDGTLIDSIGLILASFRHATATILGEEVPDEVVLRDIGLPLARQLAGISEEHADEMLRVYREHNARTHDELVREFPGTADTLLWLAERGVKMGVVTSKINAMARRGLAVFDLGGFFGVVVGMDDVAIHKPDPYPLLVAAEALGAAIERCAYVGDSPHDMTAARAAGCVAIGATWGVSTREVLEAAGASFTIDALSELEEVLLAPSG